MPGEGRTLEAKHQQLDELQWSPAENAGRRSKKGEEVSANEWASMEPG